MTVAKFKVGDQVALLSGGPTMTVMSVEKPKGIDIHRAMEGSGPEVFIRCQWFAGKKLEEGAFPPEALRVPEASKKK